MKHLSLAIVALAGVSLVQLRGLTPEEAQILSHFSLVETVDPSSGAPITTVVLTGVNLQLVNGIGSSITKNGTGNLILGYNELGHIGGDDRTGSHYLVFGRRANYSGAMGLVGGEQNAVAGLGNSVVSGAGNRIESSCLHGMIAAGSSNAVVETGGFVGSGTGNVVSALTSAILGGNSNRAGEGVDVAIAGGKDCAAGGFASAVGGGTARSTGAPGSWAGGSFFSPN